MGVEVIESSLKKKELILSLLKNLGVGGMPPSPFPVPKALSKCCLFYGPEPFQIQLGSTGKEANTLEF